MVGPLQLYQTDKDATVKDQDLALWEEFAEFLGEMREICTDKDVATILKTSDEFKHTIINDAIIRGTNRIGTVETECFQPKLNIILPELYRTEDPYWIQPEGDTPVGHAFVVDDHIDDLSTRYLEIKDTVLAQVDTAVLQLAAMATALGKQSLAAVVTCEWQVNKLRMIYAALHAHL